MMSRDDRIWVRLTASQNSPEGQLLEYLQTAPMGDLRTSVLRALKAYYLPEAFEGKLEPAPFRRMVEAAISDLQYRVFQLQLRFCPDMPLVIPAQSTAGMIQQTNSQCLQPTSPVNSPTQTEETPAFETTIAQMRESLSDVDLDQILDDF
jgi:hypothetical protein